MQNSSRHSSTLRRTIGWLASLCAVAYILMASACVEPGIVTDVSGHTSGADDAGPLAMRDAGKAPATQLDAGAEEDEPREGDAGKDAGVEPIDIGMTPPAANGHPRRFVLGDEPLHKILYVNLDDPSKDWDLNIPVGARDLQLIGNGLLLVGTLDGSGGYHEVDLITGKIVKSVLGFGRVMSARRLANGNTLLMGLGLKGGKGTVVLEVAPSKEVIQKWEFPTLTGGRMMRRAANGNYLVGTTQPETPGKDAMVEITPEGKEIKRFPVANWPAYMGLRTPAGDTVVANGHGGSLLIFDQEGKLKLTIGGTGSPEAKTIDPHHFSQFQIMPNGNYVVSNWQGHATTHGADGRQLVEYDPAGKLLWSWDQDPKRISSIHSVIVLDGLDLNKLHDDVNGTLAPVL